jgi:hypothetical protein
MRPYLRRRYLDERRRRLPREAADNHIRCPARDGWIDVSDLGCVMDHTGPLPHPAIDQRSKLIFVCKAAICRRIRLAEISASRFDLVAGEAQEPSPRRGSRPCGRKFKAVRGPVLRAKGKRLLMTSDKRQGRGRQRCRR